MTGFSNRLTVFSASFVLGVAGNLFSVSAAELKVAPSGAPFTSIQAAVDAAAPFDLILVATGVYSDIHSRPAPADYTGAATLHQVVFIDKQVGLFGGYDATFTTRDPLAYPTVIDALNQARCFFVDKDADPTIDGFMIRKGNSMGLGGALWGDAGGGIFAHESSPIIIFCDIQQCESANGGGIFFSFSPYFNLLHCTVKSNVANDAGGVYLHSSRGVIIGSHFEGNHADSFAGALYARYQDPEISDSTFHANDATAAGGALVLYGTAADVSGCVFTENYGGKGGAVASYLSFGPLNGNAFFTNSAQTMGGGLYFEDSSQTLTNNFICNNSLIAPAGTGAGILAEAGTYSLIHNTFAANTGGNGAGVHLTDLTGSPANAQITNQITTDHVAGLLVETGSSAALDYNLWHNNTHHWSGGGTFTHGTVAYFGDPLYADPAALDYHISYGSPAHDKGTDAGVYLDFDGHVRPWDSGFDIGADEIRYVPKKGVWINMPLMIHPGEEFFVFGYLENDGQDLEDVMVFFILEVAGEFWFWPAWSHYDPSTSAGIDYSVMDARSGNTKVWVINPFTWPDTGATAMSDLRIWGGMVNGSTGSLIGEIGMVSWGFGPP